MCILIRSEPPFFQSPQCTCHGKTFDTRISISWLPDLDSYAVSVGQPGDLDSRISGFSSEVDLGSWSCLGLLLDKFTCRLKSGGSLLTELGCVRLTNQNFWLGLVKIWLWCKPPDFSLQINSSRSRSTSEEKPEIRESRSPGCPTETA